MKLGFSANKQNDKRTQFAITLKGLADQDTSWEFNKHELQIKEQKQRHSKDYNVCVYIEIYGSIDV